MLFLRKLYATAKKKIPMRKIFSFKISVGNTLLMKGYTFILSTIKSEFVNYCFRKNNVISISAVKCSAVKKVRAKYFAMFF